MQSFAFVIFGSMLFMNSAFAADSLISSHTTHPVLEALPSASPQASFQIARTYYLPDYQLQLDNIVGDRFPGRVADPENNRTSPCSKGGYYESALGDGYNCSRVVYAHQACYSCTPKDCPSKQITETTCKAKTNWEFGGWIWTPGSAFSGEEQCGSCQAKTCSDSFKDSAEKCGNGTGKANGWTLDMSAGSVCYAGDKTLGTCRPKTCAAELKTDVEKCGSSGSLGWIIGSVPECYAGDTAYYICTAKPETNCSNKALTVSDCGEAAEKGWKISSAPTCYVGDTAYYDCQKLSCITPYKPGITSCNPSSGYDLKQDSDRYSGNAVCGYCKEKSCPAGIKQSECTNGTFTANGFFAGSNPCGECVASDTGAVVLTYNVTANSSIYLPFQSSGVLKVDVDWGDGLTEQNVTTQKKHTYSRAGEYDVKVTGHGESFQVFPGDTRKVIKIKQFDMSSIIRAPSAFQNCTSLVEPIPELPPNLVDARSMFDRCINLTGTIPELPKKLIDGSNMFSGCRSLTGSIPELPDTLENGTNMFSDTPSLNGNIPRLPKSLKNGYGMFYGYGEGNLTGNIPELPDSLEKGTLMFAGQRKLSGAIPKLPSALTNGAQMFQNCSGLTGKIPELPLSALRRSRASGAAASAHHIVEVTESVDQRNDEILAQSIVIGILHIVVGGSTVIVLGLVKDIVPKLPDTMKQATEMFQGCSSLTGNIPQMPSGLTHAEKMFSGCSRLTGNIPVLPTTLMKVGEMFKDCSGLSGVTSPNGSYYPHQYLTKASSYKNFVSGCSNTVRQYFPSSWGGTQ